MKQRGDEEEGKGDGKGVGTRKIGANHPRKWGKKGKRDVEAA